MTLFTTKKNEKVNPHYGDVVRWIERVIDSCETPKQTKFAERLIELFKSQYSQNLTSLEMRDISRSLMIRSTEKWGVLIEKKIREEGQKGKNKKK